jgi:hypothetical protein
VHESAQNNGKPKEEKAAITTAKNKSMHCRFDNQNSKKEKNYIYPLALL